MRRTPASLNSHVVPAEVRVSRQGFLGYLSGLDLGGMEALDFMVVGALEENLDTVRVVLKLRHTDTNRVVVVPMDFDAEFLAHFEPEPVLVFQN